MTIFNLVRREVVNVPLVGTVAAGQPILAVENVDGYFPIPAEFMPNEQSFMLKVKGDSMINAGIFDGDQVLVKQQPTADNGDIVVALVEDSATVKTFYKEKGYYRLQPENDTMDPIIITGEIQILVKYLVSCVLPIVIKNFPFSKQLLFPDNCLPKGTFYFSKNASISRTFPSLQILSRS